MPEVSVVVPVYNAAEKVVRCVNSIQSQTLLDIEIVLIDDGSVDNSLAVCKGMAEADSRIHVYHQENAGVSSARNMGIEKATGQWLMFVDADDWIEPNTIQIMVEKAKLHSADIVVYSILNEYIDNNFAMSIPSGIFSPADIFNSDCLKRHYDIILCSVCNKLYNCEIISKYGIRFLPEIKFGEDFIFNADVLKYVNVIYTTSLLMYHYDCTIENSGVKKLYPNFDEFIYAMYRASCRLISTVNIEPPIRKAFLEKFIGERWKYIFDVCLHSKKCIDEQGKIIFEWVNAMPFEMRQWPLLAEGETGQLLRLWKMGTPSLSQVCDNIRLIAAEQKRRENIVKIKRFLKRMAGRL